MNSNDLLIELRKFTLIRAGLSNIDPSQCKLISQYVLRDTKHYLSETTIKRFFGFANTVHNFSLFTLNGLAQYVGYADWNTFKLEQQSNSEMANNLWAKLKSKTQVITNISLMAKKKQFRCSFSFHFQ